MEVSLVVLIGVAGTLFSIGFAYLAYKKGLKTDSYKAGNFNGALRTDIEYIKRRTDDVLLEQKDIGKTINNISERVTRVEESAKQAHKRLDSVEDKL